MALLRWLRRGLGGIAALGAVLALALLAGRAGPGGPRQMLPQDVAIRAYPIAHFLRSDPLKVRFGRLEFIGGLELRGAHSGFGGISAIRVAADGRRFLAVTDAGDWLRGAIVYRDGRPAAIENGVVAPMLGADGRRLKDMGLWDAESLAIVGGEAFVGIEREHAMMRFDLDADDAGGRGRPVPLPPFARGWPSNRGIEALGVFPAGSPHSGRLIALSERSGGPDDPTEGFAAGRDGSLAFGFSIARSAGFDITDLDFLPNGDLILLERTFSPLRGVAVRLRRIKADAIRPDATLDGDVILLADNSHQIDNMEGLSIHLGPSGDVVLTVVSDDNFSIVQRTLLLQFRWLDD